MPQESIDAHASDGVRALHSMPAGTDRAADANLGGGPSSAAVAPSAQLLDELVPPAGEAELPGTGIDFVGVDDRCDASSSSGHGDGAASGRNSARVAVRGKGRNRKLSIFEIQALERARARQKDRLEKGEPQARRY